MPRIAIVTDSTAAFPKKQVGDVPVCVVPLDLHWEGDTYKDGVDLSAEDFYTAMAQRQGTPTTSRPSPKDFIKVYRSLLEEGYAILSIHLSAAISGTYEAAIQAQRIIGKDKPIYVHDSATISIGTCLQIMAAVRAAGRGAGLQECRVVLEQARSHCHLFMTVSTLKYLIRSGRLSWAAGLAAQVLGLRPILTAADGKVKVAAYAVSNRGAQRKLLQLANKSMAGQKLVNIAAAYTDDSQLAVRLREEAAQAQGVLVPNDALLVPLSPVIGAYAGPGAVGIAVLTG